MRAGFVAIVGLPNAGKSTLLNHLLGQKIAIASPKPQTTRNRILGVKNLPDAQLVLVDTPGLHRPLRTQSQLSRFMHEEVLSAVSEVDALLVLVEAPTGVDAKRISSEGYRIGKAELPLLKAVADARKPSVLAVNKIDRLHNKGAMLPILEAWSKAHGFAALVPVSALTGEGTDRLVEAVTAMVPEGDRLFPEDVLTDRAERWLAAEMVREQVFLLTKEEIPYSVAITVDTFEERAAREARAADVMIEATVHVEKEQQKRIVVGEGGRMIREIGSRARHEIGKLLDCEVHLKLFVRVDAGWSQDEQGLREMGYE